jgi:hypothetical protein
MGSLAKISDVGLLLLPTAVLLALGGPYQVLYCNGLSTHDGIQYFGVSLDPLGTTPYCPQPFRYGRMLFPAVVFTAAAVASAAFRLIGLEDWLQQRFVFDGFELPRYILVHAYVYHGCLLIVSWLAVSPLAGFLGSRRTAVLLVGVLLQPVLFKGLLAPLDLVLVVLCLRAIQTWSELVPTWRRTAATAGLLALALLNREMFLLFVPVLVGCHVAAHGRRQLAKIGVVVVLGLLIPCSWYVLVSCVQGVNLFTEVIGFIRLNATVLPFGAFPPFLLAGGVGGLILAAVACYATTALVRAVLGEWKRLAERRRLSAQGLWSIGVLVAFLKAGPLLLDTIGNYGRLLLLAPVVLQDFTTVSDYLTARFGKRFQGTLVVLGAGYLGLLLYYQCALYPTHLAHVNQATNFLESSWLSKIDESVPWLYRR